MNDILDFVSQFDETDDLINAVKLKKITDIMEIIKVPVVSLKPAHSKKISTVYFDKTVLFDNRDS